MKKDRYSRYERILTGRSEALLPRFLSFDSQDCASSRTIGRHQHHSYEIIFVERGKYVCRLNGERITMRGCSVLLIKPADWHEDILVPNLYYHALQVDVDQVEAAGINRINQGLLNNDSPAGQRWFRAKNKEFWPLLEAILRESKSSDRFSPSLHDALTAEIFWKVLRHLPDSILSPDLLRKTQESGFLRRLNRFFELNVSRPCSVSGMARWVGMSERSLHLLCRRHLDVSPARAFTMFRMARARLLVRQSQMSVKDISLNLGFADPYHFSKVYRRLHHIAPSKDRRTELQK